MNSNVGNGRPVLSRTRHAVGSSPTVAIMEEEKYLTNRDKKLAPKGGLFWCRCDLTHVANYQKCSVCGRRMGRRRFKK